MNKRLTLNDLPRHADISLYDGTREEVRRKYRETPGIVEVLEFGLIPLPGISDMDFFVLTEPGKPVAFPRTASYKPEQKWAMLHMHFAVSQSVFQQLRYFDPWLMQITPLLHSNSLYVMEKVLPLTEDERHALSYEHIMVSWLFAATEAIGQISCRREVPVREFLEMIKGTEYCYRELKRAGVATESGAPFTEAFTTLRKVWLSLSENQQEPRIAAAFEQYKQTISLLLKLLAEHLAKIKTMIPTPGGLQAKTARQRSLLRKYPRSFIIDMPGSTYVYQEGRTDTEIHYASWKSPISPREYGHGTYIFPLALSATQNVYLQTEGIISMRYRNISCTDLPELPILDHPVMRSRCKVMNRQVQETLHVTGSKQPIMTYGAEVAANPPHGGKLRARLGGWYDRKMQTTFSSFVSKQVAVIAL